MMYLEKTYKLTIKDAYNKGLTPERVEFLINSTFNNLRVDVSEIEEE